MIRTREKIDPAQLDLKALGRCYRVEYRAATGATRVRERDDVLEVAGAVESLKHVAAALERWLRRRVAEAMEVQLRQVAMEGGFHFARLRVRRQRTRWGSCSSKGFLSTPVSTLRMLTISAGSDGEPRP